MFTGKNTALKFLFFGPPITALSLVENQIPIPTNHDIIVKMIARPINPSDILSIRGEGGYRSSINLPAVPGFEGIGKVVSCGRLVNLELGQRVLVARGEGTWQEYVKMPADEVVVVPNYIPDEYAAQLYINPLTAWLIVTNKISKGDLVVGNAANSTMGRLFCQLSKIFGFDFVAIVRNASHEKDLLRLGAKHVITSQDGDIKSKILDFTKNRLPNVVLEAVGGTHGMHLSECLSPEGKCIIYGNLSMQLYSSQCPHTELFYLREWIYCHSPTERTLEVTKLMHFLWENRIELPVAEKIPLVDFQRAIHLSESTETPSGRNGKIILTSM